MSLLFTFPAQRAIDDSGNVMPGAKLYFSETGTSSLKAVFQDADLNTAHTNPVIADAYGEFDTIWLDNSGVAYTVTLTSSTGAQQWSADDVTLAITWDTMQPVPTAGQVGASLYPRTAAEIAASVTPTNYAYAPGNVLRYGANTTPGTTDMTAAVQAATNVAKQNANTTSWGGTPVYFPAGIYSVTDDVLTYGSNATGILFYGDGPTSSTLKLATDGTNQVYFYSNTGAQSYRNTFRDLRFLGASQTYCNGFRLNDTAGWEKQFEFENCRFEAINTVLTTTGTTNADECTFTNCEWNPVTTLLNVSNAQSMLHNFIGCRGVINGDVWVIGSSGGGEFHYIGGSIIHVPSDSAKYLINGSAGPATSNQTGQFTMQNVRFEHRTQYALLVNWPASDITNRGRQVNITFDKCNLATLNQGSGVTRSNAVIIGEGKTVEFSNCILPATATGAIDDWGYTITADNGGAPGFPNPGTLIFRDCSVGLNLAAKVTVTNTYGIVHAIGCTANEGSSDSTDRYVVNFSRGFGNATLGSLYAQPKLVSMKRNVWPYSDGASGFLSEYTAILPAGAILLRATIYKPAGATGSATVQYHIGTSDKVTSYATTTSARQDAEHAVTESLAIAPLASATTLRLWLSETTPNTGTLQTTGGYAYIEYI